MFLLPGTQYYINVLLFSRIPFIAGTVSFITITHIVVLTSSLLMIITNYQLMYLVILKWTRLNEYLQEKYRVTFIQKSSTWSYDVNIHAISLVVLLVPTLEQSSSLD